MYVLKQQDGFHCENMKTGGDNTISSAPEHLMHINLGYSGSQLKLSF